MTYRVVGFKQWTNLNRGRFAVLEQRDDGVLVVPVKPKGRSDRVEFYPSTEVIFIPNDLIEDTE